MSNIGGSPKLRDLNDRDYHGDPVQERSFETLADELVDITISDVDDSDFSPINLESVGSVNYVRLLPLILLPFKFHLIFLSATDD